MTFAPVPVLVPLYWYVPLHVMMLSWVDFVAVFVNFYGGLYYDCLVYDSGISFWHRDS